MNKNNLLKFSFITICIVGIYFISLECPTEFGYSEVMGQENITYSIFQENNIDPNKLPIYDSSKELKIPAIIHFVWLTSEKKPKEINEIDLNHIINSLKTLKKSPLNWQYILWTNNESLIPETINSLAPYEIEVKNIHNLKNFELINDIGNMIKNNSFSEASDLVRYLALQEYGGVYSDTDTEIFKDISHLLQQFDFFGSEHRFYYYELHEKGFDTLASAFLGAKKAHPVISKTVELIHRNLHSKELPNYVKNACSVHNRIWVSTGPMVLTIAYLNEGNKEGYNNVIFDSKYFNQRCSIKELRITPEVMGCHGFNGNWYAKD